MLFVARRLLLPVILTNLLLCFVVPAAFQQPFAEQPSWSAFGFATCELPCWAGITPGETAFTDAFDLLLKHVPTLNTRVLVGNVQINFSATSPEQIANGLIFEQGGLVETIQINFQLPVIELIRHLGIPHCVVYSGGTLKVITMHWESESALISGLILMNDPQLRLKTPVTALTIHAGEPVCDADQAAPWIGFAASWRYAQTQRQDGD
jgi:hypothetical protein